MISTLVTTLKDLGLPTLAGVVLGAGLSYVFGKRLADDAWKRSLQLVVIQADRDAAERVEDAVGRLRYPLRELGRSSEASERVWDQAISEISGPAYRLRNRDLKTRATNVPLAILVEYRMGIDGLARRVFDDASGAIDAFLAGEDIPESTAPPRHLLEEARDSVLDHPTMTDLEGTYLWSTSLQEWLEAHPPPATN